MKQEIKKLVSTNKEEDLILVLNKDFKLVKVSHRVYGNGAQELEWHTYLVETISCVDGAKKEIHSKYYDNVVSEIADCMIILYSDLAHKRVSQFRNGYRF